jgi:peptidoglycan/xylan/chitin deacetylase (PgdA/CDA1 family)
MRNVHDRAIILSHDLYGTTAQAMERVIPELIAQGYQLVTVSELLSFQYDELEAGKVYFKGN